MFVLDVSQIVAVNFGDELFGGDKSQAWTDKAGILKYGAGLLIPLIFATGGNCASEKQNKICGVGIMKEFKTFVTDICIVTTFLFVSFVATTNVAYAHCDGVKHGPGHRHCEVEPPPDPGDNPCATSQTFPAFVYWDASGGTGARLTLSDAEGACTHALTSYDNGGSITGDSALHYDPSSESGRVIWTDKLGGTQLFLVEFSVAQPGNVVSVLVDSKVLAEGPWGSENGSVRHPDIAPNGDTMGFIYRWPSAPQGATETGGYTIYTASIDGCSNAAQVWNLLDPGRV